jgi:50S ribosomal protein L16 3-hydroxylase
MPSDFAAPLPDQPTALLGGLTPAQFMRRYWQKRPLLIRQAIPPPHAPLSRDALFQLAASDEVEARLIARSNTRGNDTWQLDHGPFETLPSTRRKNWTLLVQGVNLHDDAAYALMNRFRFVPDARLDDLMMSYATDGGGVGPHFDSYDVFLLQVQGQRRWRIGAQRDLSLRPGLPLKVLQHFEPTEEWVLEPGDMLYLPPHIAHDGIAIGECITCSIGFRAPLAGELVGQFLYHAAEQAGDARGAGQRYSDRGDTPAQHPACLPARLVDQVEQLVAKINWSRDDIAEFVGEYMSEPKAQVFFNAPEKPLSHKAFSARIVSEGLSLDRKTQLLYDSTRYYINGESHPLARALRKCITNLADARVMHAETFVTFTRASPLTALLHEWYLAGWIRLGAPARA